MEGSPLQIPERARSLPPSDCSKGYDPTYPFISAIKMGYFTPLYNDRLVAHLVGSVAFFFLDQQLGYFAKGETLGLDVGNTGRFTIGGKTTGVVIYLKV